MTDVYVYSFHVSLRRDVQWCEFAVEAPRVHTLWVFNRKDSTMQGQLHIMVRCRAVPVGNNGLSDHLDRSQSCIGSYPDLNCEM